MKKIIFFLGFIFCVQILVLGQEATKVKIYDERANPIIDIESAIKKASLDKKNILIQIGGNWCSWCVVFDKLIKENKDIAGYLDNNYEVVHINYSQKNKNEKILAELKHPERFGFPVFVILDDKGNLIHTQNSAYLESKNKEKQSHDPKLVLDFLKSWSYKALDPVTYSNR